MKRKASMSEILANISMYHKKIAQQVVSSPSRKNGLFVTVKKASDTSINGVPIKDIEKDIMARYDSVMDIIKNYEYLSRIRNDVNARIIINIAGSSMTIAQALVLNSNVMREAYNDILNRLKRDYEKAIDTKAEYDASAFSNEAINNYLQATMGVGVSMSDANTNQKIRDRIDEYREMKSIEFVDPININEKIKELETFIEEFFGNVSFKLAELNARIIVEYDMDNKDDWRIVNLDELKNLYSD